MLTSPKVRLGSKEYTLGRTEASNGAQRAAKNASPGAMLSKPGNLWAGPAGGLAPASMSKTIVEPGGSQWPQYLNSLKNVVVEGPGSQAYATAGYSSVPSIKKPLVSAKKANIMGLAKGFPGRGRAPTGFGHQNFGYRVAGGQAEPPSNRRGTKQLRSDSPRHQEYGNQLAAKEEMFQRVICQTQISAGSGGGSASPPARADSRSGQATRHNIK